MSPSQNSGHIHHYWKMRLFIALCMVLLSFIGFAISEMSQEGGWNYWRTMVPLFAVLSLSLSWYMRIKGGIARKAYHMWRELAHWMGLVVAVYLITIFVNRGYMGRFDAGLVVLTLLSFSLYLFGVYIEPTFIVIGLLLGFFSLAATSFIHYLFTLILPITVLISLICILVARRKG